MVRLPDGEKMDDTIIRFGRIDERDGHTDRRTHRHRMAAKAALHLILMKFGTQQHILNSMTAK